MDVQMPDGTVITGVPDGTTKAQLSAKYSAHLQGQKSGPEFPSSVPIVAEARAENPNPQPVNPGPASLADSLQANPVLGAPLQTAIRAGQGVEQLLAHGAASASDLGGLAPNDMSKSLRAAADYIDRAIQGQNKGYEEAGERVDAASGAPQTSAALRHTGEIMANAANPAGAVGTLADAAPGIINAGARGFVSGAAYGASQPVLDSKNYWLDKAKQVGIGGLTGAVTGAAAEKLGQTGGSPPSSQTYKELAGDAYDASKAAGVKLKTSSLVDAINEAENGAKTDLTYRPATEPKMATALATIRDDLKSAGDNIGFEEIDVARKVARKVLSSPDRNERAVAHYVIDKIDDYVDALKPSDVVGSVTGDPALIKALNLSTGENVNEATASIKEARALFARGAKLETVERLVTKAQDKIGANQTRTKLDNAIRQEFAALLRNQRGIRQFSPEEQDAIRQIVRGTTAQNIARWVGKASPTTTVPILGELLTLGHALSAGSMGEAGLIAGTAGAGLVGQGVANSIGESNVAALKNTIAGRTASAPPEPVPQGLIWGTLPAIAGRQVSPSLQPYAQ